MASTGVLSSGSRMCETTQLQRSSYAASSQLLYAVPRRSRPTEGVRKEITANQSLTAYPHSRTQHHSGPAERHNSFSGLASYRFRTQDIPCRWLEACVREAVAHIDDAPFLQVTHTLGPNAQPVFGRTVLPDGNSLTSQMLQDLTQHATRQHDAETVLYLAPLNSSPDISPAFRRCRDAMEVLTGITATPVLRGHVGDCCDGDEEHAASPAEQTQHPAATDGALLSQIVPLPPPGHRQGGRAARHTRPLRSALPADAEWGLVVQSQEHEALNGCYILRTSSSRDPDCQCTHFSLVRAQEGQGVAQQMMSAWLA